MVEVVAHRVEQFWWTSNAGSVEALALSTGRGSGSIWIGIGGSAAAGKGGDISITAGDGNTVAGGDISCLLAW